MRKLLGVVAILAAGTIAWLVMDGLRSRDSVNSPDVAANHARPNSPEAPRQRPATVSALAALQPAGGLLDVAAPPGDRVATLLAAEGQSVPRGKEIAVLESATLRQLEWNAAQSALAEATRREPLERAYGAALVAAAEVGVEQAKLVTLDVQAQQARLALAEKNLEVARGDVLRIEAVNERIISVQERDHARLRVQQAEAETKSVQAEILRLQASAKTSLAQAEAKLNEARTLSDRLVAALQLESLRQNVALAEQRAALAVVRSPIDGQVLQVLTRQGETISQRPIVRMADTTRMVAVCEVYETSVWCVAAGQRATISSKALDKPLNGTVERVGSQVAKNEVLSLNPTEATDNRVVAVRVAIDPADTAAAANLINLQVDVTIHTAPTR